MAGRRLRGVVGHFAFGNEGRWKGFGARVLEVAGPGAVPADRVGAIERLLADYDAILEAEDGP